MIFSVFALFLVSFSLSDADDSPLKRTSNQCGQYLCPTYATIAGNYISSGCEGRFDNYLARERELIDDDIVDIVEELRFSTHIMFIIVIVCGFIGFVIGSIFCSRYKRRYMGYSPLPYYTK